MVVYIEIMKQSNKSKTKEETGIRDEIRGLGVMIEHVNDKVSLVAEHYGDIKKTLNSHTEILNSHTEMIGKLAVNMEIVKTDIELIKHSFKKKIDIDEFAALEKKVLLLEKRR